MNFLFALLLVAATSSANPRAQEILNRVTNTVAQISNNLRKTYVGKIKSAGTTSLVVITPDGDRTVSTNEVTTYFKIKANNRSEINFPNLKIGDDITAFGTVDPANLEMTAKQIIAKIHRYNIVGVIESNDNNVLTIKEINGPSILVDISQTPVLKKNLGTLFTTAKLADFKVGLTVAAIAYADSSISTLSGLKIVLLTI